MQRNIPHESAIIISSVTALLTLLIISTVLLFNGETTRNRILIEYQAEQTVNSYIEIYRDNPDLSEIVNNGRILGLGLYYTSGKAYKIYGDAPKEINSSMYSAKSLAPYFNFDSRKQVLIMMRPMGMQRGLMGNRSRMNRMPAESMNLPHFVYIKMDISDYFKRQKIYRSLLIMLPVVLLILLGFFIYLYRNNVNYRKKMHEHEHLIALGEAARTLTHEIKNPLGAIRIQTGYLKRVLPEERKQEITVIEEEVDRISSLTDKIGDFLKNPEGNVEKIELDIFIKGLLKRFNKNISYKKVCRDSIYTFFDRERLRSVLENLIKNALESGENLHPESKQTVEIELDKRRNNILIFIRDRGAGIPDKLMNKVFDPFYTTKTKGSGIGLALSKRFIEAMKGNIRIKRREHGGTEVQIILHSAEEES